MEAKDTAKAYGELVSYLQNTHRGHWAFTEEQLRLAQAEISFHLGEKQGWGKGYESGEEQGLRMGKQEGMRKVVEWFMTHGYSGGPIQYLDGIKARFDPPWDELQAKLKEWGIEEV